MGFQFPTNQVQIEGINHVSINIILERVLFFRLCQARFIRVWLHGSTDKYRLFHLCPNYSATVPDFFNVLYKKCSSFYSLSGYIA